MASSPPALSSYGGEGRGDEAVFSHEEGSWARAPAFNAVQRSRCAHFSGNLDFGLWAWGFPPYIRRVTFLPIAARELRVASRKRSTFWLRILAAIIGLVVGAACMLIATMARLPTPDFGSALFGILTWLSLAAALTAGIFFTSDCLSEEKREGTLGFLFLTDLRGYDVLSGKLLATSLRGLYALLAIFPILALTLLMGGVTGGQFWMALLAVVNGLFISLAAGMFVSAI